MKKRQIFFVCVVLFFFVFAVHTIHASLGMHTEITNSVPTLYSLTTYDRYTNATDNFPVNNLSVCIGETNRTVYIRFVVEDKNSHTEISNATWHLVAVINGSDVNVSSFGNYSKELTFESYISGTQIRYLENITLEDNNNKTLYKIITLVTDVHGNSSVQESFFTLHDTDCIRVEQDATLVTTESFSLTVDYFNLAIVVNENITGRIIITLHNQSPVDANTREALDKYMTVDVEGEILQKTVNLSVLANYTQQEVINKGIIESSLRIYKFGSWNVQEGSVNVLSNTVDFVINESVIASQSYRLGTYSVRGDLIADESGGGSSGGSGGGSSGGGGSALSGSAVFEGALQKDLSDSSDDRIGDTNLFDIELSLVDDDISGDELVAIIGLRNIGRQGDVRATLLYTIRNDYGDVIYEEEEFVDVETQIEFFKTFDVRLFGDGKYSLVVDLLYEDQKQPAQARVSFNIRRNMFTWYYMLRPICCIVFFCIAVIFFLLFLRERRRRIHLKRMFDLKLDVQRRKSLDLEKHSD